VTQDELDALPEVRGVAIYQPEHEDMAVVDAHGQGWMLGRYRGVRVKSPYGKPCWFGEVVGPDGVRYPYAYYGFARPADGALDAALPRDEAQP